jgi:hypothetical protein
MKPSIYFTITLISILLAGAGGQLFARNAQIIYLKAPKDAPQTAYIYQKGSPPFEVELSRNNFSDTFKLADGEATLYFLGEELVEGEVFPEGAPSIKVPADRGKILILAFSDRKNQVFPVQFKVVNANDEQFGPGDRMFINFTDSRIVGDVGRKTLNLAPFSISVLRNAGKPKEEYQVRLDRVDSQTTRPVTFIRQTWRQSTSRRSLIFIYSPSGSKRVTYYSAPIKDL